MTATKAGHAAVSELIAAVDAYLQASGHVSPFGNDTSVMGLRNAGKYMAARERLESALKTARKKARNG